jgi:hypothetical protein
MTKKKDPAPTLPPALAMNEVETAACANLVREGFVPTLRRRYPVLMPLSDAKIVELGKQAEHLDAELRELRQSKNAKAAALTREKHEREGAMRALSERVRMEKDELGKKLDLADLAKYTRLAAAARRQYDEWEVERKAILKQLKVEFDEKETGHAALSATIDNGKGPEQVSVIDLMDFRSSTVASIRADTGEEVSRRALEEHERQQALFISLSDADSLTDKEYGLCVQGRSAEAIELYAARHPGMDKMKARTIVVGLVKQDVDEELPPDAGGEK